MPFWRACNYLAVGMIYLRENRLLREPLKPEHGAPGVLGPVYLEGTYSEVYPGKSEDEEGMRAFFRDFSFPSGIGSPLHTETRDRSMKVARRRRKVGKARPTRSHRRRRFSLRLAAHATTPMTHSEHSPLGVRPLYIKDNSSSRSTRPRDKE